jgi:TetR/AcrR family transcriptional regulator, transcriptional repressor for nem operon
MSSPTVSRTGQPSAHDPNTTRERLLDAAQTLVLAQGFAGTSVDGIAAAAGLTKGAFFHHFENKHELAEALLSRYAAQDAAHLAQHMATAERLATDPAQQLLVFVGLFADEMAALSAPAAGCLYASYAAEAGLLDADSRRIVREALLGWRTRLGAKLDEAIARHGLPAGVPRAGLEDLMLTVFEGAFILSRVLGDAQLVAAQLRHVRQYLALLFDPPPARSVA